MLKAIKTTQAEIRIYRAQYTGLKAEGYTAAGLEKDCEKVVKKFFREAKKTGQMPTMPLALEFLLGHPEAAIQAVVFREISLAAFRDLDLVEVFVKQRIEPKDLPHTQAVGLALFEYAMARLPEPETLADGALPEKIVDIFEQIAEYQQYVEDDDPEEVAPRKRNKEATKTSLPGNLAKWDAVIDNYYHDNATDELYQEILEKFNNGEMSSDDFIYEKFLRNSPLVDKIISEWPISLLDVEYLCQNPHLRKNPQQLKNLLETCVGLLHVMDRYDAPGLKTEALLAQFFPADKPLNNSDRLRFLAVVRSENDGGGLLYIPSLANDPLVMNAILPLGKENMISDDAAEILVSQLAGQNWLGAVKRIIQTEADFDRTSKGTVLVKVIKGAEPKNLEGLVPRDFASILASGSKGTRETVLKKLTTLTKGTKGTETTGMVKVGRESKR